MVKKFISYYKNHKFLLIVDLLAAALVATLDLVLPAYSQKFIDEYIPNKDSGMIIQMGIIFVAIYLIRIAATFVMSYWGHVMGTRIEHDMRNDLFEHFQKMSPEFYSNTKVGYLMSRLVGDLRDISEFAHHGPEDLFISFLMLFGSLILMLQKSVYLTLIVFSIVIVMITFTLFRRKRMRNAFRKTRQFHAELNGSIENSLAGIRLTKAFTNEGYELEKFAKSNADYQESWHEAYYEMGVFHSMMQLLMKMLTLTVIIIGGLTVIEDPTFSVGELVAFIMLTNVFMQPVRRLVGFFDQFQRGFSGFERFFKMMNTENDLRDGNVSIEKTNGQITFEDIEFSYGEGNENVLTNFNLEIEAGQSVALVGKTGVGKSTLAKLLPRFYDVTSGKVILDGIDIKDLKKKDLRRNIAYIQQDSHIFFGTILENILYGRPDASVDEVIEAAKKAEIHEFIDSLEDSYETEVGERGIKLSGGQKQRISLARIFLKNAPILVLDEATSALDNKTETLIQKSIENLSLGRTSLIVAHRLTTVQNCDKIVVLGEDGIIESGSHDQLMKLKGEYFKLYTSNIDGFI